MSNFKHLSIATEAIDFQNGAFFKELTLALNPYVGQSNLTKNDFDKLASHLDKLIQRHTGINSSVYFSYSGTCVFVPGLDGGNPILGYYLLFSDSEDGLELIEKIGGRISGLVNLNKSELKGVFTKPVVRINIEYGLFNKDLNVITAEEIAAILLHEIGHYFTYCEMLDQTVCGNFILMGLDRVLRNNPSPAKREAVIEKAGEVLNFERDVIENLKKSSSDKAVTTVFISRINDGVRSQSKDSFYDQNSWEMVSDQFATRHGAGRHLVTGLDKIYNTYGKEVRQSKFSYYLFEILNAVRIICMVIFAAASAVTMNLGGMVIAVLLSAISYAALRTSHYRDGAPTYDKPLDRAMRVRRQLIEYSKNSALPKEMIDKLINDVKLIDDTVKNYSDRATWMEIVDQYLFKSSRKRAENIQLQKDLERLAMNDLFLSSAELKHL